MLRRCLILPVHEEAVKLIRRRLCQAYMNPCTDQEPTWKDAIGIARRYNIITNPKSLHQTFVKGRWAPLVIDEPTSSVSKDALPRAVLLVSPPHTTSRDDLRKTPIRFDMLTGKPLVRLSMLTVTSTTLLGTGAQRSSIA